MCVWSTVSISCNSIEVSIPPIEVIFPTTDSYHEYHTVILYWLSLHSKYFMQNSIEVSIPPIEVNGEKYIPAFAIRSENVDTHQMCVPNPTHI